MLIQIIIFSILILCGVWILFYLGIMFTLRTLPKFQEEFKNISETVSKWPKLSVIIPACNEEAHIEEALKSVLKQNYPNLEIIAVNDRSQDKTGEILNKLAKKDNRLKPLHIKELPAGWLGKVHAMHKGVKQAKGKWYLFTDADVHFEPNALKKAMLISLKKNVDHLAIVPETVSEDFFTELVITAFGFLFLISSRVAFINRPASKRPVGVGAFNLVSEKTFKKTPGFKWLKMEPVDDFGLGLMVKNAGGATRLLFAEKGVRVSWYANLKEMFKGFEKNLFGMSARYRLPILFFNVTGIWTMLSAPPASLAAFFLLGCKPCLLFFLAVLFLHLLMTFFFQKKGANQTLYFLFAPLGFFIFSLMMLWSGYRCVKNKGVSWRGMHYSIKELREGQRVKL